jgi:3-deoxy-alpha-D-manno-octulosonate 8-oxidase
MSVNVNKNSKHVGYYAFGAGTVSNLPSYLEGKEGLHIYLIDHYFKDHNLLKQLPLRSEDVLQFIDTTHEPKTTGIDELLVNLRTLSNNATPAAIIGIGGGSTLDTAKAIANLYTNDGKAENYQGWDLVKNKAIYKIGIPTISGTGAESSRTCVMTNVKSGLKLGMNSDFTIYDQLVLDPNLTGSVPKENYFYTGMDTYIHCIESLDGQHRNAIGDAFSREALQLCREVFLSEDMKSDENREKIMVASYLGGVAIANSYVGIIHPFSAGLSVVLGTHHCIANCMTMMAMEEFYPQQFIEFNSMAAKQGIIIPRGIASNLSDEQYVALYNATVIHEKPLSNALGANFKSSLTLEKVTELFKKM